MFEDIKIWIRGAGELASGTAVILHKCGFQVVLSELPAPLAIRRTVTFSDAIITGSAIVEDVPSRHVAPTEIEQVLSKAEIPLLLDSPDLFKMINPKVIVDARMLKKNITGIPQKKTYVIGLGPGFTVGQNCHTIIETKRGHELGKIIWEGSAAKDTGMPGMLGGETLKRVIKARTAGELEWRVDFGNLVRKDELMGTINFTYEIKAPLTGIIRGLIAPTTPVTTGLKIADIDPRGKEVDVHLISDKSRSVGRGVLEAILHFLHRTN